MLLDRLSEHHRTIEALAQLALPLLQEGADRQPQELSRLRWNMVRALTAYQQFKHREIFDPAISRGGAQLVRMSEALKADCVALGDEFTRYVQTWTTRGSDGHWPEYRLASVAMIERIRRHLRREERDVASLFRAARVSASAVWPVRAA